MTANKLLIIGDSFSSGTSLQSWNNQLGQIDVVNLSSNGSSQYRIYKKLISTDLSDFTHIILVHTSPYRIYIDHHQLHYNSLSHKNCDLIYEDIKSSLPTEFSKNVAWYFENIFDLQQADHIHDLLIEKMISITADFKCLHVSFFPQEKHRSIVNLSGLWKKYPGHINHLDINGNKKVAEFVKTVYNF